MFDIGFSELLLVGVVGLLVIGPERLPGAIRTGSLWLNRIKRGFNDIKREVQQELHNDEIMQQLRNTGQQIKEQADEFNRTPTISPDKPAAAPQVEGSSDGQQAPAEKSAE
jgi:sec-independent protein translocase protein TatB